MFGDRLFPTDGLNSQVTALSVIDVLPLKVFSEFTSAGGMLLAVEILKNAS